MFKTLKLPFKKLHLQQLKKLIKSKPHECFSK